MLTLEALLLVRNMPTLLTRWNTRTRRSAVIPTVQWNSLLPEIIFLARREV